MNLNPDRKAGINLEIQSIVTDIQIASFPVIPDNR
jgi:hypothetical protein